MHRNIKETESCSRFLSADRGGGGGCKKPLVVCHKSSELSDKAVNP